MARGSVDLQEIGCGVFANNSFDTSEKYPATMSVPLLNPPGGRARGNSAGKSKPLPIPGSGLLPPSPLHTEPYLPGTMYALVVCGANNTTLADQAMFSDFMGISCTLGLFKDECPGTFLSCFPIEKYFEETPHSDIKFGMIGPAGTPLFTYSARKHSTREGKFFQQVPEEELLGAFTLWIQEMAHKAKPGDAINIFLQCHGGEKGQIYLGTKFMCSSVLANLLETFIYGVQVNCIGSHCHSGILVDKIKATGSLHHYAVSACGLNEYAYSTRRSASNRCRGFRFAQPFVQSLAKCKLPTVHQTEAGPLAAKDFNDFMKDALQRVSSAGAPPQHVQTHLSSQKQTALILLEELVFRDQVDVLYDPRLIHRRRRFEWPTLDLVNLRRVQQEPGQRGKSPTALAQVITVVDKAVSACYGPKLPEFHPPGDSRIIFELERKNPDYEMLLNNLYWRGRQQSAIFDLWIILCERGFVRWENMEAHIDYSNGTGDAGKVYRWLSCFTAVHEEERLRECEPFPGFCPTEFPLLWLAIMIARGCSDEPHKIFEIIHYTGILGKLDPKLIQAFVSGWGDHNLLNCDPKCRGLRPDMPTWRMDYFGSWLPNGLGPDKLNWSKEIVHKFMSRFWAVEKAYKDFHAIPDDILVEECHQAGFLRRHSDREPRLKHSGHWKP
ncbi:hypothetical protein B7463_g8043, partial [Scytalidium lignicola]